MKLVNNVATLNTSLSQRQDQFLHNLTLSLTAGLENPFGAELVTLIGSGHERTNREALATWVKFKRHEVLAMRLEGINALEGLRAQLLERIELERVW